MGENGVLALIIIFAFLGVALLFTLGMKVVKNWVCTSFSSMALELELTLSVIAGPKNVR